MRQKGKPAVIMQTELERLQDQTAGEIEAEVKPKREDNRARERMANNMRAASGPYAGTDWRSRGGF